VKNDKDIAFEYFFNPNVRGAVKALSKKIVKNFPTVANTWEDLQNEAMFHAWSKITPAWLYTLARNKMIDMLRHEQAEHKYTYKTAKKYDLRAWGLSDDDIWQNLWVGRGNA